MVFVVVVVLVGDRMLFIPTKGTSTNLALKVKTEQAGETTSAVSPCKQEHACKKWARGHDNTDHPPAYIRAEAESMGIHH